MSRQTTIYEHEQPEDQTALQDHIELVLPIEEEDET